MMTVLAFLAVFLIVWVIVLTPTYTGDSNGEAVFRVEYQIDTYDPTGSEMSSTHSWQDVVAESPEKAIDKAKQALEIQTEREKQDFGESLRQYHDFQAKKL